MEREPVFGSALMKVDLSTLSLRSLKRLNIMATAMIAQDSVLEDRTNDIAYYLADGWIRAGFLGTGGKLLGVR